VSSIDEIRELENRLRLAELGPDPDFFNDILAEDAILDGQRAKAKVVAAHQPGKGSEFTKVEMTNFEFVDHGFAVVVTCTGSYESPQWSGTLKFMRVWLKRDNRWLNFSISRLRPAFFPFHSRRFPQPVRILYSKQIFTSVNLRATVLHVSARTSRLSLPRGFSLQS